ncbi:ATP-binding cassette domain-containing protein [Glaciihabitans arcticus]|uniref:ATP-binding cassette domain-containing protein n=1 Tax=Glaciihabitans arcticus TaxID=2668039 RepID=A0A4Q9GRS5_9MICO|nr:ATP-binding cassette domain-containing protein [Glaciihabitans arcticus]TBN55494.1 ATP-binding cassette domain-containing protein [Glaciihabitans arcticus]
MTTTVITEHSARATRLHPPLLAVTGLTAHALGRAGVTDVSLDLTSGSIHGVYAAAGAGASTLTAVIAGELVPTAGSIALDGSSAPTPRDLLRGGVTVLRSRSSLLPGRSIAANIFLGREPRWCGLVDLETMRADAAATLSALGASLDLDARVALLSRSEQRLVELARAFASDARLVVVDDTRTEPDAALSPALAALAANGAAVLRISADIAELVAGSHSVSSI